MHWLFRNNYLLIIIILCSAIAANAQSTIRFKQIYNIKDTIDLDSLSIIKSSFKLTALNGKPIDSNLYTIDYLKAKLIWNKVEIKKTIKANAHYRTFPFNFYKPYFRKNTNLLTPQKKGVKNPFSYSVIPKSTSELLELGGIEKTGSISRGVGFGNNRDLSVSSSMNLQFSGKIASNLFVTAAISDENIPIQPEGNTQQLQDFDQVFVKLYNDKASLIAGDFLLKSKESYFMKYNKKSQGLTSNLKVTLPITKDSSSQQMNIQASAAISRGKFARNIIQGVEGNQGPYRLKGNENESFIIVLSGTERIYIDGKKLKRGQNEDYIINYNTAEVFFTTRQLITKDKRIIVEFQYSDQNFTRTLFQFNNQYQVKKLALNFNVYSEQDAKNQSLQQELNPDQKQLLASVGDSLNNAYAFSGKQVEFSDNEVLYKLTDSLGYDSVFVFSSNPDSAIWRITFTNVGEGNGNYVLLNTTINGRVFQWVEPGSIGPRGDYEPVVVLYSPKQKQLISLGGKYIFSDISELSFEGAISNNDINTFSSINNDNNIGGAFKANINKGIRIFDAKKGWIIRPFIGVEHWGKSFSEIERIRTVEFYREWNIRNINLDQEQNIYQSGIELIHKKNTKIEYKFEQFDAADSYNAQKNNLITSIGYKGIKVNLNLSTMESKGKISNTKFVRHKATIIKKIGPLNLGYKDDREDNRIKDLLVDTLSPNAYKFWEREYFLTNYDSTKNKYKIFYAQREDYKSLENRMERVSYAENYGVQYQWNSFKPLNIKFRTVYRTLSIQNEQLTTVKPDENLLSRLEYNLRLWKGSITANSFYEIGSGLEAKREYKYIEVPAGQGQYTWIDANKNEIQEINEFEIAIFNDQAKFIRIFILTNDYVKVFTNQFNQSININPNRVWNNKTGVLKFLAAFSNQTAYRIDRKTQAETLEARFLPAPDIGIDSQLVSLNSSFRNSIYFNRSHQVFGMDLTYQEIKSRILLINGLETKTNGFFLGRFRWNISRNFLIESETKWGEKTNDANFVSTRNYAIDYFNILPKLTYQPGVSYRIALFYEYKNKQNMPEFGGELAIHQKMGLESRFQKVGKGSLLFEIAYINIQYQGVLNGTIDYELLDGLLTGDNGTWQVTYQRNIGKYMQLNIGYNGRSSQGSKVIHTGNVRMRAYF